MVGTIPSLSLPPAVVPTARPRILSPFAGTAGLGRGNGVLAGTYPDGLTTIEGVPTEARVRAIMRSSHSELDGVVVAEVSSAPDGTWEICGLSPDVTYDVVARKETYNDAIVTAVSPYTPPHLTAFEAMAIRDAAFSYTLQLSGGEAPYTTTIVSGALPSGLTLSTGVISGTAIDVPGTFSVDIEVDDARSDNPTTRAFNIYLVQLPLYMSIGNLASYYESGDPITTTFTARGGEPPYTYAVTTGSLPTGTSLDTSTGELTGSVGSASTFVVTATDSNSDTYARSAAVNMGTPHAYWRVNVTASNSHCSITELEMASSIGGTDQCNGGTATASSYHGSGLVPAYAFDNILNDSYCWASGTSLTGWIQYAFPSPVIVKEVRIDPRYTYSQYPTAFTIESSDDGVTWNVEATYSGLTTGWALNTMRSFPV